tara:strand:- start:117 stop:467 length:351 start_codon:yes stop_codon:yes gene_type:complete
MKELTKKCISLISKSLVELGQTRSKEDILILSNSLAHDLVEYFPNLSFSDIEKSFSIGIRESEEFHLSVKTYFKWIKQHQKLIWDQESKEPEHRDKRLQYRSRSNTGLLTIQKLIK